MPGLRRIGHFRVGLPALANMFLARPGITLWRPTGLILAHPQIKYRIRLWKRTPFGEIRLEFFFCICPSIRSRG